MNHNSDDDNDVKIKQIHIKELIDKNFILFTLMGFAVSLLIDAFKNRPESDKDKYYWFLNAVENIVYHNKPPPPLP